VNQLSNCRRAYSILPGLFTGMTDRILRTELLGSDG
jgi:hypothetical protein